MTLTGRLLLEFVLGQMEFQNPLAPYLFRGRVEEASVAHDGTVTIGFAWLARDAGYPASPGKTWVVDGTRRNVWRGNLKDFVAHPIGEGRIRLTPPHGQGESAVLFLPNDGRQLDFHTVQGLGQPVLSER